MHISYKQEQASQCVTILTCPMAEVLSRLRRVLLVILYWALASSPRRTTTFLDSGTFGINHAFPYAGLTNIPRHFSFNYMYRRQTLAVKGWAVTLCWSFTPSISYITSIRLIFQLLSSSHCLRSSHIRRRRPPSI